MPEMPTEALLNRWERQLRKGLLNYLVLAILNKGESYGYELIARLSKQLNDEMAEGTIYPLLSRLQADNLITSKWKIMESGPARKYYTISGSGKKLLKAMDQHWSAINKGIEGM